MMTDHDLLILFDKGPEAARWIPSVDAAEYLSVVTYLCLRNNREAAA